MVNMETIDINEVQDLVKNIDTENLLISTSAIAHGYDHNNLDEGDIYNLLRDVLKVVTTIEVIKDAIKV